MILVVELLDKKTTISAISSAVEARSVNAPTLFIFLFKSKSGFIAVATTPGATAFTMIPYFIKSLANPLVSPSTPHLDKPYGIEAPAIEVIEVIELIFIIFPFISLHIKYLAISLVAKYKPLRFVSVT